MMGEKIKLYVWKNGGGISRYWDLPDSLATLGMPFFIFGRFGGGYLPFGRMNQKTRETSKLAAIRARQRFGVAVEIYYSAPKAKS
jgi:hypothetical protein